MSASEFFNLESALRALRLQGRLSHAERRAIRDSLFLKIGSLTPRSFGEVRLMPRLAWLAAVPAAIFALLLSLATGVIAQQAVPGEPLFALKRVFENLQLFTARDPLQAASVRLQIADDRVRSLTAISDAGELDRVLSATQVALGEARQAVSALPSEMAENLVNRFEGLLEQQNLLLDRLSKTTPNEEIKGKIVAIKEEVRKGAGSGKQEAVSRGQATATAPAEVTAAPASPALSTGPISLEGRLITSNARPAVVYDSQIYLLDTPVNLFGAVGSLVFLKGDFDGAVIKISYLVTEGGQVLISPNLSTQ